MKNQTKNTVTEEYLRENYQRYTENLKRDDETPDPYETWRLWFINTFGVEVET